MFIPIRQSTARRDARFPQTPDSPNSLTGIFAVGSLSALNTGGSMGNQTNEQGKAWQFSSEGLLRMPSFSGRSSRRSGTRLQSPSRGRGCPRRGCGAIGRHPLAPAYLRLYTYVPGDYLGRSTCPAVRRSPAQHQLSGQAGTSRIGRIVRWAQAWTMSRSRTGSGPISRMMNHAY